MFAIARGKRVGIAALVGAFRGDFSDPPFLRSRDGETAAVVTGESDAGAAAAFVAYVDSRAWI